MAQDEQAKREAMANALRNSADGGSTAANLAYRDAYNEHVMRSAQMGNPPIPYQDFQRLMQYQARQAMMAQQQPQQPQPQQPPQQPPVVAMQR